MQSSAKRDIIPGRGLFQPGRDQFWWALVLVPVALVVALYVAPIINVLMIAFTQPDKGLESAPLGNFSVLFTEPAIGRMLWRTAKICCLTTVLAVFLGYIVAYVMAGVSDRHRSFMLLCIMIAFWMSVLIRTFSWLVLLRNGGFVHSFANEIYTAMWGGTTPLTLSRTEFSVLVGMVHFMLPLAILPLYIATSSIDRRTIQASRSLGANAWQTFWLVAFPQTVPGIQGAATIVFVFSLGFYVTPALLGGGKVVMIAEYMSFAIQQTMRWGLATMLATVLLFSVAVTLIVASKFVNISKLYGAK